MSKKETELRAVNIRGVPVKLIRNLKSTLAKRGITMQDWFILQAAKEADTGRAS
jgi:hypothetical protein